ncbi:DUF551 domain-containing protein [Escherichia coli]|uniref:DUF551 domain-containing protein n=1 Tax=Escherichia coli TaxID=562 RepID=UPI00288C5DA3|nr:DUF551 domain-containing protein [Escherichia coli]
MTPKQSSRSYCGEVRGYRDGWNACRASMLHGEKQWIPCSERMPEEEQGSVIGWNAETCEVGEYFYDNDEFECFSYYNFCGYHSFNADVVTHWMPLPSSPQKESGNG